MARKPRVSYVQLRLPPEMAKELRQEGETNGRKLPSEIVYRLTTSLKGAEPEIDQALYGGDGLVRTRALAQAVGHLIARLDRVVGASDDPQRDRATTLAMAKVAIPVLLDQLGAKDEYLTADHRALGQAFAKSVGNELATAQDPERAFTAPWSYEGKALAHIAKGLSLPKTKAARKGRKSGS